MSFKSFALFRGVVLSCAILSWGARADARQLQVSTGDPAASNSTGSGEINGMRLVQFSGVLRDPVGAPLTGVAGIRMSVYKDQEGGSPLWSETQNVQLDAQGNYTLLLGATRGEVPAEIFASNEPRWLGVQALVSDSVEQPRRLFVSVPYALKASDADTLGGKPLSAFVLADSAGKEDGAEALSDKDGNASDITVPGPPNSLAKYDANGVDLTSSLATEAGGNVVAPGSFTGSAHWLNGFGSAFNSNGYAMSAPNTIIFSGNGQPRMTIAPGGEIGIGTTAPTAKLDVTGAVKASTQLVSSVATGTAPLVVNSTTQVANLNASLLGGMSAAAARIRGIVYLAGCDTCSVLTDVDDQNMIYLDVIGPMTIESVTCNSDAGNPTINILRDDGSPANILAGSLTCPSTGGTVAIPVVGESVLNLNEKLNFAIVTAGGVAKRITVAIKATVN